MTSRRVVYDIRQTNHLTGALIHPGDVLLISRD